MNTLPATFKADLRYPVGYKNIDDSRWFQWSSLPMIEQSALDTYHFVKEMILRPAQKILEVGCGNGYLSLELARDGHDVTGIDLSQDIIEVAERTKAGHPDAPEFGKLTYICTDFAQWKATDGSFDAVIFNRTLHHMIDLQPALSKVKRLLRSGGRLICHDYAYDLFDDTAACWVYQMQRLLFLTGLSDEDLATTVDDAQSIEALRSAWLKRSSDHGLNRYEEMYKALQATFHEQFFASVPYLFVYIGNGIRHVSPEKEGEFIAFVKGVEQYLIDKRSLQSVGFRYVGSK